MNFHVIGIGSIGSLIATHLRRALPSNSDITLIGKRPQYSVAGGSYNHKTVITVNRYGSSFEIGGFNWEIISQGNRGYNVNEGKGGSVQQSDILRDLVYNQNGSVREAFKYGTSQGKESGGNGAYQVRNQIGTTKPLVFSRVAREYESEEENYTTPIKSLIVTTKAHNILPAIKSIQHRLSPSSTIVLLHNGMGVYEQIVSELYKNAEERPHFILGTVTHGVWKKGPFEIVHTTQQGTGAIRIGIVPDWRGRDFERTFWESKGTMENRKLDLADIITPSMDEDPRDATFKQDYTSLHKTMQALISLCDLSVQWEAISEVQIAMRQKLAANCIINPLTALMDVRNGELFTLPGMKKLSCALSEEASNVFTREAQEQGGDEHLRFKVNPILTAHSLDSYTQQVARMTAPNYSSMLVDLRRGATTEIAHLNEYVVKLGQQLGVPTPHHEMMASLIKAKWHTGAVVRPTVRR